MKIASIVGARPQFIKLAPLERALRAYRFPKSRAKVNHIIIHSGQHYDDRMNRIFFRELGLPDPDYNLEVRSGPHGRQTGEIMKRAETILLREKPDWTLVYGDTNTTLAGALAAAKLTRRVAHIEAGLRSYDRAMPEETNRVLTDHCSDILFCPTPSAVHNLEKEGFNNILNQGRLMAVTREARSFFREAPFPWVINVGDIMFDALLLNLAAAGKKSKVLDELKLQPGRYTLATIHRAENTDVPERLRTLMAALREAGRAQPVVFPVHPRTRKYLRRLGLGPVASERLKLIEPVGYFDMLILEKNAAMIWTDSGGIQKEAYLLKVPCLTFRETTEWRETLESGSNILVGSDEQLIREKIGVGRKPGRARSLSSTELDNWRAYGNGHAAERIVSVLLEND